MDESLSHLEHEYQFRSMKISSAAFRNDESVPKEFTSEGDNHNPPLNFFDVPPHAKSLAVVVQDPDTPYGTQFHWLIYNISPNSYGIGRNSKPQEAVVGSVDGKTCKYDGPELTDSRPHRYIFTLYALDTEFQLPASTDAEAFTSAIQGHVVDEASLIGIITAH